MYCLHTSNQFWQLVMTLFQQHVDVGPSLGNGIFDIHQDVIQADAVDQYYDNDTEENKRIHVLISFFSNWTAQPEHQKYMQLSSEVIGCFWPVAKLTRKA